VAISDPPRESSRGVVRDLARAGVRVVLVSGDHASTARSVATRLALPGADAAVVAGPELATFLAAEPPVDAGVFARIRPEQKVDIVDHFRARGEVVAMTGDGVNDAPALRRADIGVAMGASGTEVARQAADLVLLDDELSTLVRAVQEGRRVYANIRRFLRFGISGGLAEVVTMLVGPFLGMGVPLLPGQILWINMLTHGLPGVAFSTEPGGPDLLDRPPVTPDASIVDAEVTRQIAAIGTLIAGVSLAAGVVAQGAGADVRSAVFAALGLGQLAVALGLRARVGRRRLAQRGLEVAVLGALVLQVLAVYLPALNELLGTVPLPLPVLATAFALALLPGIAVRLFVRGG
jgi:P-type Ca2+ transporter type 2C